MIKIVQLKENKQKENTLYLLDEPTTVLHPEEVEILLSILKELVSSGNTVVAIEHIILMLCAKVIL